MGDGPTPEPFQLATLFGGLYEPTAPSVPNSDSASTTASANGSAVEGSAASQIRRVGGAQPVDGHLQLARRRLEDRRAHLARRLHGGVAGHERHARGVGAEVHRRQVGVGGDHADVLGPDAQLLPATM